MKGANRHIKDDSGLTPMDVAEENLGGYEVLRPTLRLVKDMLQEPGPLAEFAMLKTPSKPVKKNNFIVGIFLLLITTTFGMSSIVLDVMKLRWVFFMEIGLLGIDMIFFFITWNSKSSYIYGDESIEFVDLMETFDAESLCPFCEIIRLPRSRHCNICNRCVERYDHHCPWVNNCIGKTNHFPFYMHLIFLILYIVTVVSTSGFAISNVDELVEGLTVQEPIVTPL